MVNEFPALSVRSVLVSVGDLNRSSIFYQSVMNLHEVAREDQVAVLSGETGPFTLYLRQALRNAIHPGQEALGVRSLACEVSSAAELDQVEERLRALGGFRNRENLNDTTGLDVVLGFDPDRLPLTFVAHQTKDKSPEDYRRAMTVMYALDA